MLCILLAAFALLATVTPAGAQTAAPPSPAANSPVAGNWAGTLDAGAAQLRLVLHITAGPNSTLAAVLDSVDQNAHIPADTVDFSKGTLTASFPGVQGKFVGTVSTDGQTLVGTWTQGVPFPLTLTRTDKVPEPPRRPQEPKPPFPYATRDVTYPNTAGGVTLAGTLSVPKGVGPFPCAILVTGSGPQDRDETLMGHKPFLVIADYLTRHGIAVLRVDDRGVGGSTGKDSDATDADFAGDVFAGITFLRAQPDINPKKIGVVGHSEGGLVAPLVAVAHPKDVAFVVLLAGPGVPGEQILLRQEALIIGSMGGDASLVAWQQEQQQKVFAVLKSTSDDKEANAKLLALLDDQTAHLPTALQPMKDQYRASFLSQMAVMTTPWFRGFLRSNPAPVLQKVTCPVLALGGSKDLQVPEPENLDAIKAALKAGGNHDATVQELPGLNHLFQTATTGALSEYSQIEETFAPAALQVLGDWITAHTK